MLLYVDELLQPIVLINREISEKIPSKSGVFWHIFFHKSSLYELHLDFSLSPSGENSPPPQKKTLV
jgi:hypothetical protein